MTKRLTFSFTKHIKWCFLTRKKQLTEDSELYFRATVTLALVSKYSECSLVHLNQDTTVLQGAASSVIIYKYQLHSEI